MGFFSVRVLKLCLIYRILNKNRFSKLNGAFENSIAIVKEYPDSKRNPLTLYAQGDIQKRVKLLNHPEIESLLFIHKKKLHQLFLSCTVQEFDEQDTCSDKIGGVLGKDVNKYTIMNFDQNKIMENFVTYLTESTNKLFKSGSVP